MQRCFSSRIKDGLSFMISVIRNNSSTMVNRNNKETILEFWGTGVQNCDRTNKWFADSLFVFYEKRDRKSKIGNFDRAKIRDSFMNFG